MEGSALKWQEESNETGGFVGTRLCPQSLVCYTFGDRGWRKGVVRGGNKHFPSATEQADFGAPRAEIQDLPLAKSACSGVGDVAERREFRKKFLESSSITGEPKGYQARRSDVTSRFPFRSLLHTQGCRNPRHRSLQRMLSCSACTAAGWKSHPPA